MSNRKAKGFTWIILVATLFLPSCNSAPIIVTQELRQPLVSGTPAVPPTTATAKLVLLNTATVASLIMATTTSTTSAPSIITPSITLTVTSNVPIAYFTQAANCRSGPGTKYDAVTSLLKGSTVEIVGRNPDPNITWLYVKVPPSNRKCWISLATATASVNVNAIPIIATITDIATHRAPPEIKETPTPIAPPEPKK